MLQRARRLYAECAAEGVDVGAAALQFPLGHPAVAGVVAGLRTAGEVATAVTRMTTAIQPQLWERLKRAGLLIPDAYLPGAPQ